MMHSETTTLKIREGIVRSPSEPIESGPRYAIGRQLGRGGMGEVLAARDGQIGREVAVKRLHDPAPSPVALARFLREARIQGRLEHPAIPAVHELGVDADGRPYFAMKRVEGTSLSDILRDPGLRALFPRPRLLRAFADVCLAIEYAHERGVIHRDLKPGNILLGDYGDVYVIDWGVARMIGDTSRDEGVDRRMVGEITLAGSAVGTPGYMSPEQVLGRLDLDGRADVYALGCLLYEILTGSPLHPRGDAGMRSALGAVDARPSHAAPDVPPELDELCVRATAVDPAQRLGSARVLGATVQHYLDGDRDLALRARLAREHLAVATMAISVGDDEQCRRTAMSEAGRALALDPTLTGAAEVIGRLMLTPAPVMPKAVVDELALVDRAAIGRHAKVRFCVHLGYIALALVLLLFGANDPIYIPLLAGIAAIGAALDLVEMNTGNVWVGRISLGCFLALSALFARMFTPFLIAPGIGVVAIMAFAFHPQARGAGLYVTLALGIASILGMWAAELIGWLPPTMQLTQTSLALSSPVAGLGATPLLPTLCGYVVVLFVVGAVSSRGAAREARTARERLHVQAWQLRQLLSR